MTGGRVKLDLVREGCGRRECRADGVRDKRQPNARPAPPQLIERAIRERGGGIESLEGWGP